MKKLTYKCDRCGKTTKTKLPINWIEIGDVHLCPNCPVEAEDLKKCFRTTSSMKILGKEYFIKEYHMESNGIFHKPLYSFNFRSADNIGTIIIRTQ